MKMLQNQDRCQEAGAATAQGTQPSLAERRSAARTPVIKSGKLVVGGELNQGVLNCLILDQSATGVLIDLGAVFALPEEMVLHLGNGPCYRARRRWAVGTKAGLEFIGQVVSAEASAEMAQMARLLTTQGLPAALAVLRSRNFLGQAELREAAEAAEAAYAQLETLLNPG
jgi:hypothetical protein